MSHYEVRQVHWLAAKDALFQVRHRVFCCEWRIPESIEFDDLDINAFHILAVDEAQNPIASGRLLPNGHIGRIAVIIPARGKGVAKAVVNALLDIARKEQMDAVFINSALEATDNFKRQGFKAIAPVFMEAGIPRQRMKCKLGKITELDQSDQHH
ncbi:MULTISPECIES: GNAT family N-acetyltransferase [Corallincola]|uniref:GNAT family N-acetyltransferase n=3 Tax=Corallincola TaxID=1775176 RepID=A0A368NRX3_9GAMM|nr:MULTISPECIES: GNAT family N-acetyltransferase [Corallincola]RCU52414.1 GNAT family N-acetyltransferase [Corallincola holothuriorum]TAA48395.1 GNAT family N-acetyltransferase [Corallincola spongiicola]TCI01338.1 GNAT family N-acetyltransferase [Corallincola luteus]